MTQIEIKKMFNQAYKHTLMTRYKNDRILWREEFSSFIDGLCRDGAITEKQYNNIEYPRWMK